MTAAIILLVLAALFALAGIVRSYRQPHASSRFYWICAGGFLGCAWISGLLAIVAFVAGAGR